jgi:hypothetical protein
MLYALKTLVSALIIVLVGALAKRSQTAAALLLALPLVSVLSFVWLHIETGDARQIADLSFQTFWFVLPTLPLFLLLGVLLRHGVHFYLALGLCALLTALLFAVTQAWMPKP